MSILPDNGLDCFQTKVLDSNGMGLMRLRLFHPTGKQDPKIVTAGCQNYPMACYFLSIDDFQLAVCQHTLLQQFSHVPLQDRIVAGRTVDDDFRSVAFRACLKV